MVLGNLACVTHGASMVYPGEGFDPLAVLETVQAERCTGAPWRADHVHRASWITPTSPVRSPSLRTGIMAGSPCPIEVMKRVCREMHMREITIAYGMTETSPVSFQSSTRRSAREAGLHRRPDPAPSRGQDRRYATGGSCRGAHRASSDPRLFGHAWLLGRRGAHPRGDRRRRWMHTGDLATLDDEGYCNIVGRIKDMVIRGGENIYPREIEEFLYTHPKIADVQVFGVPDAKYGEQLCAWVRLREGDGSPSRRSGRILPRLDRALQDPATHPLRRRIPDDGHGQNPEIRHAAENDR